ncbi:MAG TPA: hypothetical protein VFD58_28000 [Blastocatellia bacterium]|nr:hypothetical protein [Blastocatellia bacterium]
MPLRETGQGLNDAYRRHRRATANERSLKKLARVKAQREDHALFDRGLERCWKCRTERVISSDDCPKWKGTGRRRSPRLNRSEPVWLHYLNSELGVIRLGGGRTGNVSCGGARVCVEPPVVDFELVKVIALESGFESLAAVTSRYLKEDGLERLCLQLIGREWPV